MFFNNTNKDTSRSSSIFGEPYTKSTILCKIENVLNKNTLNKTIIHNFEYLYGFGDYLRGSILLAQYSKINNIKLQLCVSDHNIRKYLENEEFAQPFNNSTIVTTHGIFGNDDYTLITRLVDGLIKSDNENLYIYTNFFYDKEFITHDIKKYINTFFTFKKQYYDKANEIVNMNTYKVLHIRCVDEYFDREFNSDKLILEIIKLQLDDNTFVMSNNYSVKKKIHKLFGYRFINEEAKHLASNIDSDMIESTIIEYIILSQSSCNYCFSFYGHGSGFSEQCSILNNIPYIVSYIPYQNIIQQNEVASIERQNELLFLSSYYEYWLEWPDLKKKVKMANIPSLHSPRFAKESRRLSYGESGERYELGLDGMRSIPKPKRSDSQRFPHSGISGILRDPAGRSVILPEVSSASLQKPLDERENESKICNYDDVAFITLTNSGYVNYTMNCIESLRKINTKIQLQTYCIGKEGYDRLINNGISSQLIDDEQNSNHQTFLNGNWSNITYYKFEIIYENLLKYDYVCFTDGDIVYENANFIDFLLQNIDEDEMLIQSEGFITDIDELCSGFMFIRSNANTLSFFNPDKMRMYKDTPKWNDQLYINENRNKIKYRKLPLSLFPTGSYYYKYNKNITPYLIHFNFAIGHDKIRKMLHYNKWMSKIKICQCGVDDFGHQLEGTLRLLSLSINDKAEYQPRNGVGNVYIEESLNSLHHMSFFSELLRLERSPQQLILLASQREAVGFPMENLGNVTNREAILHVSLTAENTKGRDRRSLTVGVHSSLDGLRNGMKFSSVHNEPREFCEIVSKDIDYKNTIYSYDGVHSNILKPYFEHINELEKALPTLRKAFVENNRYLPRPSYDNRCINVCCHIRLGDAIGTRILDYDNICNAVKYFQKYDKYRIIIHSDGDVNHSPCFPHLASDNTIIYGSTVDVLQVLSDFIFADILIINYSSLSIAAHLLADKQQIVICPSKAVDSYKHRILPKCINCDIFQNESLKIECMMPNIKMNVPNSVFENGVLDINAIMANSLTQNIQEPPRKRELVLQPTAVKSIPIMKIKHVNTSDWRGFGQRK